MGLQRSRRRVRGRLTLGTAALASLLGCGDDASSPPGAVGSSSSSGGGTSTGLDASSSTTDAMPDTTGTTSGEGSSTTTGGVPPAELEPDELRPGGDTTVDVVGLGAFVQEAANLTLAHRSAFEAGVQFFQLTWEVAPSAPELDGLGPTYNAASCLECHVRNGRAEVELDNPASPAILIRLADARGAPDPGLGGQLQPRSIPGVPHEGTVTWEQHVVEVHEVDGGSIERVELVPSVAPGSPGAPAPETLASPRLSMQLVGMGLLEAIPRADLEALADPDDRDEDGISGRLAVLEDGSAGRFGWKSGQPTVRHQVAGAFLGDLGITSTLNPTENCPPSQTACVAAPDGGSPELTDVRLDVTSAYVRLLGVPARRGGDTDEVLRGKAEFHTLGCAACHRPSFTTGTTLEVELQGQHVWPYTDLLLHDMGPGLAQGGPEGDASAAEWRTPPLWGLGLLETVNGSRRLLHDGRARTLAEAIAWHGGEAQGARDAYLAASSDQRASLHAFIDSL